MELYCVLSWNLSVEIIDEPGGNRLGVIPEFSIGGGLIVVITILVGLYWWHKKCGLGFNPNILGARRSLSGTPREFNYKNLRKATNNFDEQNKLGLGGYGVVYKGLFPVEDVEVAVKKF